MNILIKGSRKPNIRYKIPSIRLTSGINLNFKTFGIVAKSLFLYDGHVINLG